MYIVVKLCAHINDFPYVRRTQALEDRDEANRVAEEWFNELKRVDMRWYRLDEHSVNFCGVLMTNSYSRVVVEVVKCLSS